jgi:hypothetical protein
LAETTLKPGDTCRVGIPAAMVHVHAVHPFDPPLPTGMLPWPPELGDEVADRNGRAWRFDAAWNWHPFDGEPSGTPTWPLKLITRHGEPTPKEADEVARATAAGSHSDELERWSVLTHAALSHRR